jgi:hypothetical protein
MHVLALRRPARPWHSGGVTPISTELEQLVPAWLTLPEVAERLGLPVNRARQLLKEKQLIAVRRGESNSLQVPAAFLDGGQILKGLPGTLTLLSDNSFSAEEAVRWLFTPDESLPGTPVEALAGSRGTEVRRRAHALAF